MKGSEEKTSDYSNQKDLSTIESSPKQNLVLDLVAIFSGSNFYPSKHVTIFRIEKWENRQ